MDRPNNRTSTMAGLPDDVFVEILPRVFPLDLPRSKCVSKAWRHLIDDLLHCKEHPRTLRGFLFMDEHFWDEATRGGGGSANGGVRRLCRLAPVPASLNFHLVHFLFEEVHVEWDVISVHTYSSETRKWSRHDVKEEQQSFYILGMQLGAFVNDMLHVLICIDGQDQIIAVDVQRKTHMVIPLPETLKNEHIPYFDGKGIAHSQGCLYLIGGSDVQLSIWVLEDYKSQKWVLKDTVTYLDLFGDEGCSFSDFYVVTVHQDCSILFLRHKQNLILYDMDSKVVSYSKFQK
ncbi:hypothetical protein QOZ80_4BG0331180 [Eleusine coracana subsp. coracana]|nr:hypothetical protein QOZ80_4BG0331180 [Eleusine coracana subsp. coracana]